MSFCRGACPALSAPMQTGDGLLVRLATAGASLKPVQLIALCAAADRHGNGLVEITARGNFQIRGLTKEGAGALARDIKAMQLGLRDGVPVETNPLAGMDPSETANAAPLAVAIREAIDATDLAARLAPKVSVIVDGGGADDLSALSADVRLTAWPRTDINGGQSTSAAPHAAIVWLVSIGGDAAAATPLAIADDEATATAVTLAILEAVAARGRSARGRDLAPADMKALLPAVAGGQINPPPPPPSAVPCRDEPLVSPALRPTRFAGEDPRSRSATPPDLPPLTGEGDHAKRDEGGVRALTNDRFALPVALPFGSIRTRELMDFLDQARAHGAAELRLAPGRTLILICQSKAGASDILNAARAADLIVDAADPRARIFACPGSAGCASGHIAAREIARSVARNLSNAAGADFELHISGCPKGCAHPAPAALTLVGTEDGPRLAENGTARESGIPYGNQDIAERLASALKRRTGTLETRDEHNQKRPERAFAGD